MSSTQKNDDKSLKIVDIKSADFVGYSSPHDAELESTLLGAIIVNRDLLNLVAELLRPEVFYTENHKHIYAAIQELYNNAEPIDLRTVVNQLRKNGKLEQVGGSFYVASLTTQIGTGAAVEYYARVILEFSMRRDLIFKCIEIQKASYDNTKDIFDVLDQAESAIFEITNSNLKTSYEDMGSLMLTALKQIEENKNKGSGLTGVPSGLTELDKITSGWQKSDLVIVAARPGMGKTAFVLSAVRNAAVDHSKPVGMFSLEMSSIQLVNRLISSEAEISNEFIKRGTLENYEWEKIIKKTSSLSKAPIYIDDTPAISIFELKAKCRRLKAKYNVELIVIDYLQLMSGDNSKKNTSREQEIASISRSLKNIAKELNIPIICLSQLSRAVESRGGNKRPQLSDLRESGAIEQDADMVLLLYRPEYYGITEDEMGNPTNGLSEVIIAKHRNGSLSTVNIQYHSEFTRFSDRDQSTSYDYSFREEKNHTHSSKMNDF